MTRLNPIVAGAMIDGLAAGLFPLYTAASDPTLAGHHRAHAARAPFLEDAGDPAGAMAECELAASPTHRSPTRSYLPARRAQLLNQATDDAGAFRLISACVRLL